MDMIKFTHIYSAVKQFYPEITGPELGEFLKNQDEERQAWLGTAPMMEILDWISRALYEKAKVEVGKKYPGPLPPEDGSCMQINSEGGLSVVMAFSVISDDDITAFKSKDVPYGLFIDENIFPVALLVWKCPEPINIVELPFNLADERPEIQKAFLAEEKSIAMFLLVDRMTGILKEMTGKEIDSQLMSDLHEIAKKQLNSTGDYNYALDQIYNMYPESENLWDKCKKYQPVDKIKEAAFSKQEDTGVEKGHEKIEPREDEKSNLFEQSIQILLESKDWEARLRVAGILGKTFENGVIAPLAKALEQDKNEYVRALCVSFLGTIGQITGNLEATKSVIDACKDEESYVRKTVAETLYVIKDPSAHEVLEELSKDSDEEVRTTALRMLSFKKREKPGQCPFLDSHGVCIGFLLNGDPPHDCSWEAAKQGLNYRDCAVYPSFQPFESYALILTGKEIEKETIENKKDQEEESFVESEEKSTGDKKLECPSCGTYIGKYDTECIGCGRFINW